MPGGLVIKDTINLTACFLFICLSAVSVHSYAWESSYKQRYDLYRETQQDVRLAEQYALIEATPFYPSPTLFRHIFNHAPYEAGVKVGLESLFFALEALCMETRAGWSIRDCQEIMRVDLPKMAMLIREHIHDVRSIYTMKINFAGKVDGALPYVDFWKEKENEHFYINAWLAMLHQLSRIQMYTSGQVFDKNTCPLDHGLNRARPYEPGDWISYYFCLGEDNQTSLALQKLATEIMTTFERGDFEHVAFLIRLYFYLDSYIPYAQMPYRISNRIELLVIAATLAQTRSEFELPPIEKLDPYCETKLSHPSKPSNDPCKDITFQMGNTETSLGDYFTLHRAHTRADLKPEIFVQGKEYTGMLWPEPRWGSAVPFIDDLLAPMNREYYLNAFGQILDSYLKRKQFKLTQDVIFRSADYNQHMISVGEPFEILQSNYYNESISSEIFHRIRRVRTGEVGTILGIQIDDHELPHPNYTLDAPGIQLVHTLFSRRSRLPNSRMFYLDGPSAQALEGERNTYIPPPQAIAIQESLSTHSMGRPKAFVFAFTPTDLSQNNSRTPVFFNESADQLHLSLFQKSLMVITTHQRLWVLDRLTRDILIDLPLEYFDPDNMRIDHIRALRTWFENNLGRDFFKSAVRQPEPTHVLGQLSQMLFAK